MNINIKALTDVGKERATNEDAVIVCPDIEKQNWYENSSNAYLPLGRYGALMVVADGMGGANAGEIASSITVETMKLFFARKLFHNFINTEQNAYKLLSEAIRLSHEAIMEHVIDDPDSIGMGTTVVITWIIEGVAYVAWCGDSRCYCFNQRDGMKQLTKDHSYVQELVDKGEITAKQAFAHPDGNIITKCLGDGDVNIEPDMITYQINDGDVLLSCSDGLCGYCDNKSIGKVLLNRFDDLTACRDELLELAMKAGGQDNISIALCATLPNNEKAPCLTLSTKIKRFIYKVFG